MRENLTKRSITSVAWTSSTGIIRIVVLFVRSILLARLLELDTFGTFGYANTIIVMSGTLTNLGLDGAFLHRSEESADEQRAAAVHFTIRMAATALWTVIMLVVIFVWTDATFRVAMLVLTLTSFGVSFTGTAQVMLKRRVVHRRLALYSIVETVVSTVIALTLAYIGYELWALLSINIVTLILSLFFFIVWRPVWRPRFVWDRPAFLYFFSYGQRTFAAKLLAMAVNRVDDLWAGTYLGNTPLALYQRAYTFANYPRRVVADPVATVSGGTFAELKDDRKRLSQAFFRTTALLIRSGFLFGGALVLIAPEFITLLLTEKWLPMLTVFRIMLLYTLLEPLDQTLSNFFVAIGRPESLVRIKVIQFAVLGIGLFTLGNRFGLNGAAITIDLMMLIGIVLYLRMASAHIDFSLTSLLAIPLLAIAVSIPLTLLAENTADLSGWFNLILKGSLFTLVYCLILLMFEREQFTRMAQQIGGRLGLAKLRRRRS